MKQITIVARNRAGLLAEITEKLAQAQVNIETLDVESLDTQGIMVLTVDHYDAALEALREMSDIQAYTEDVLVVRLRDEPGALARLSRRLSDAGIAIKSLRIIKHLDGHSLVAVCTDRQSEAAQLLALYRVT